MLLKIVTYPDIWFPYQQRNPDRPAHHSRSLYRVLPRVWDSPRLVDLQGYWLLQLALANKQHILSSPIVFVSNQFHFMLLYLKESATA